MTTQENEQRETSPRPSSIKRVDHTKKIIEVIDVSFSYGNGDALSGITLDVHDGDYLGLVGPNGAGKTTLLKIMLGLLLPTKGQVKIFGQELKKFKQWSDIGYVPQKATNFDPNFPATVKEVVLMGRYGRKGLFRQINKEDENAAEKALKEVGMNMKIDLLEIYREANSKEYLLRGHLPENQRLFFLMSQLPVSTQKPKMNSMKL